MIMNGLQEAYAIDLVVTFPESDNDLCWHGQWTI